MAMTITQKILAGHSGLENVEPGQLIMAEVDMVLGNDITAPVAIQEFQTLGYEKVFDNRKIALIPDHFTPNKDIKSAHLSKQLRDFAFEHNIEHYYEIGKGGIEHVILPEKGLVLPGDLVIGADSHTCTYGALGAFSTGVGSTDMAVAMATGKCWLKVPEAIGIHLKGKMGKWVSGKDVILYIIGKIGVDGALYQSMEFYGEGIKEISIDGRLTIANMAIEAGAKNGIFPVDSITREYVKERTKRDYTIFNADDDVYYRNNIEVDLTDIHPQVAFPSLPENAKAIDDVGEIKIDQVVIGSCTNGRIEDMKIAADILRGNKVHKNVRLIVIPGSQQVYLESINAGYIQDFINAGASVSTPTCGPCLGGHMGILAAGEKAVSTTNRNFIGRMGHTESQVYLAGPAIAAASAITGKISSPEEVQ